ncbi:MAG: hypothetical protein ISR55_02375 [Bacteroidetes bacterium]|nr:hypothetical protein [Bacteroidota bacterium]
MNKIDNRHILNIIIRSNISYQILLANSLPVFGLIFFSWNAYYIIAAYFLESIVIGFINIFKIGLSSKYFTGSKENPKGYFVIPFFIFHYGFFIFVQLTILNSVLSMSTTDFSYHSNSLIPNFIEFFSACFNQKGELLLVIFLVTHLFDFMFRYVRSKSFKNISTSKQMFEPYVRIFVQQFIVIFGAFMLFIVNSGTVLVVMLVLFKTCADLIMFNPELRELVMKKSSNSSQ